MKRIYISGPMTGLDDHNFPEFDKAARAMREKGHDVCNPADISREFMQKNPGANPSWEDCMRADIRELVGCTGIYMLMGWQRSRGARLELFIAEKLGMSIEFQVKDENR